MFAAPNDSCMVYRCLHSISLHCITSFIFTCSAIGRAPTSRLQKPYIKSCKSGSGLLVQSMTALEHFLVRIYAKSDRNPQGRMADVTHPTGLPLFHAPPPKAALCRPRRLRELRRGSSTPGSLATSTKSFSAANTTLTDHRTTAPS